MPYIEKFVGCQDNCKGFCCCPNEAVFKKVWVKKIRAEKKDPNADKVLCVNGCVGYCNCGFRV